MTEIKENVVTFTTLPYHYFDDLQKENKRSITHTDLKIHWRYKQRIYGHIAFFHVKKIAGYYITDGCNNAPYCLNIIDSDDKILGSAYYNTMVEVVNKIKEIFDEQRDYFMKIEPEGIDVHYAPNGQGALAAAAEFHEISTNEEKITPLDGPNLKRRHT